MNEIKKKIRRNKKCVCKCLAGDANRGFKVSKLFYRLDDKNPNLGHVKSSERFNPFPTAKPLINFPAFKSFPENFSSSFFRSERHFCRFNVFQEDI